MMKHTFLLVVLALGLIAPTAQAMTLDEAVAKIDAMIAEMRALRAELAEATVATPTPTAPTPAVAGAQASEQLTLDLSYGATNDNILRVQTLLATDAEIYPDGIISGFFGPKTQEAIRRFQARFGLDTVGVIGPSTKALLELFLAAYPDDNFPADVLKNGRPTVSTPATPAPTTSTTVTTPTRPATAVLSRLSVEEEDDEYIVRSHAASGERNRDLILYPDDWADLVSLIARALDTTEAEVRTYIDEDDVSFNTRSSARGDEDDAEEALEEADEVIDEARDEIREASDDGDDVEEADEYYDEAREAYRDARDAFKDEDYDEAIEKAEEAKELAEEALDELGIKSRGGSDDVVAIEVDVREDEARVSVEYDDGDDERFDVDDTDRDDIIAEVADELDMDEDEVEDLIEFDYGDIDRILVVIEDDGTRARVYYESGADEKLDLGTEDDEDDIVEDIAKKIDARESDVERALDVDDRR